MFASLKTAAVSAMVAFSTLAAIPATAQAEGLYLNFGGKHDGFGVVIGQDGQRWHKRDRWDRKPAQCNANRAVDKAERLGLRRARVVDASRHSITVSGRKFGDRVFVTFGKAPNCPILR